MHIVTVGIDLAKNVFAVHGIDATGKPVLVRHSVSRAKLLELIATLPPRLIGMEACSGAHHRAREFKKFGHTARLMTMPNCVRLFIRLRLQVNDSDGFAADSNLLQIQ